MPARRGLLIDVCWQTRECTTNNHVLQTDESCLMPLTLIAVQKIVEIDLVEALETTVPCFWNREISVSRHISIVLPKMAARDSARDNAMYEAENDQLISKFIEARTRHKCIEVSADVGRTSGAIDTTVRRDQGN